MLFPAYIASFPFIFLPSLSITFEVAFEAILLTNPGKTSLAKGMARSVIFLLTISITRVPNLLIRLGRNLHDLIILDK